MFSVSRVLVLVMISVSCVLALAMPSVSCVLVWVMASVSFAELLGYIIITRLLTVPLGYRGAMYGLGGCALLVAGLLLGAGSFRVLPPSTPQSSGDRGDYVHINPVPRTRVGNKTCTTPLHLHLLLSVHVDSTSYP
jgi:hypothetical protein